MIIFYKTYFASYKSHYGNYEYIAYTFLAVVVAFKNLLVAIIFRKFDFHIVI